MHSLDNTQQQLPSEA